MKKIIVATKNKGKLNEFKKMLEPEYQVLSLFDYPEVDEAIEDGSTFAENALIKAKHLNAVLNEIVISDDSGLCVEALNGEPGIYSARYAGEDKNDFNNCTKLLKELENETNRKAYFVCAMAIYGDGIEKTFEGRLHGVIAHDFKGTNGFGYDPIFMLPDGRHLAELESSEKNTISHRSKALKQLMENIHEIIGAKR